MKKKDRFDQYLSSIDTNIKMKDKDGRMTEIALLVGLVNVWSVCAEVDLHNKYDSRGQYVAALACNKALHPSQSYNIRNTFLVNLRDQFLSLKEPSTSDSILVLILILLLNCK